MKENNSENHTRIIHGNTEIIIKELASESEQSLFKVRQKKVAIRVDKDIYDFIIRHYGERGFTRFYHIAASELIEKMIRKK